MFNKSVSGAIISVYPPPPHTHRRTHFKVAVTPDPSSASGMKNAWLCQLVGQRTLLYRPRKGKSVCCDFVCMCEWVDVWMCVCVCQCVSVYVFLCVFMSFCVRVCVYSCVLDCRQRVTWLSRIWRAVQKHDLTSSLRSEPGFW